MQQISWASRFMEGALEMTADQNDNSHRAIHKVLKSAIFLSLSLDNFLMLVLMQNQIQLLVRNVDSKRGNASKQTRSHDVAIRQT